MNIFITRFVLLILLCSMSIARAHVDGDLHKLTKIFLDLPVENGTIIKEGYTKTVSGSQIYYHSPLPEKMNALISRTTDGTMSVSWQSEPLSGSGMIQMVWLAGMGVNLGEHHFDLYVNDRELLTFTSSQKEKWVINGRNNTSLAFHCSYTDIVGDLFGLMILTVPSSMFPSNEALQIMVKGQAENSSAWYMTFCYDRAADALRKTRDNGVWYRLKEHRESGKLVMEVPVSWHGKPIQIGKHEIPINNKRLGQPQLNLSGTDYPARPFFVDGKFIDTLRHPSAESASTEFHNDGKVLYRTFASSSTENILEVSTCYTSGFVNKIIDLSKGPFSKATLELITSSHQDIAWMDDPQACMIKRDTSIISPALQLLRKDPEYHYSAEQALMLYEYLERHPESLTEIQQYSCKGRLEWGASFNQPYEGMYYGESLIRQFYLGRKWLKNMLPGYDPKVYFNIDVPGRTIQMPQIASKSGVDYMIISRHEQGYFFWESPDGSRIGVHSPGHYHHASDFLRQSIHSTVLNTPGQIDSRKSHFIKHDFPKKLPVLLSSDMSRPRDMRSLFDAWDNISLVDAVNREYFKPDLPAWRYNTFQPVLTALFTHGKNIPVLKGERPNVWLYIHGPSHHKAISASREGGRLLPVAEIFSTISAAVRNDWESYPQDELNKAWLAQIYPDHGWGGHDGQITDELFKQKSEQSRDDANKLIKRAVREISQSINVDKTKGYPLVVFNPLSWKRDAVLNKVLNVEGLKLKKVRLTDSNGEKIPADFQDGESDKNGYLTNIRLDAIIHDLPPVGYKTVYLNATKDKRASKKIQQKAQKIFENKYYKIEFTEGGIKQIVDRTLNRKLVNAEKFLFGEVFVLKSEGNGAGEFDAPQLPSDEYFEKMSQYKPIWQKTAGSSISTIFEAKQKFKNSLVVQRVVIFEQIKRIDFEVDIVDWDGTKSREYRIAFPLNQDKSGVTYEVPFSKVTVGKDEIPGAAGERYKQIASELHPREVLDWISASDKKSGLTFSSDVAVWDYLDPTSQPVDYTILQPVLLASRKSCHWEGNWYLQQGTHQYRFSMLSHEPGWQNGYKIAKGTNMAPQAVQVAETAAKAYLPAEFSFLNVSNPGILLSTLKKDDAGNDIIMRFYEAEGEDRHVKITWFKNPVNLKSTNLIEEEITQKAVPGNLPVTIGKHAIETFKLIKGAH